MLSKKNSLISLQEFEFITAVDQDEEDTLGDEVTNRAEIQAWKKEDIIARRILLSTIDKKLQTALVGCKTAHEIMLRLSSQHAQKSTNNKYLLNKDFNDYEYNPGTKIFKHSFSALKLKHMHLFRQGHSDAHIDY